MNALGIVLPKELPMLFLSLIEAVQQVIPERVHDVILLTHIGYYILIVAPELTKGQRV
jgi:hypothetical protein